jgi:hypothetical protein
VHLDLNKLNLKVDDPAVVPGPGATVQVERRRSSVHAHCII